MQTPTPIAHDSFTLLATRRYARTVDAGKPQSVRFYRALGTRLALAAAVYATHGEADFATFCADRARDCRHRADYMTRAQLARF